MDSKKRGKFPAWHARKVAEQAVFNFQEELLKYCESDVKLLKEGCLKFVAEFEEIATLNPLVEAVTIASTCNLFWRREKVETDLIAVELKGGWRGNHINQSKIALEWFHYQDHLLGGMGRVRHLRNGGEVQVGNPDEMVYVDDYDETTHTIFEFYGCFYHRCPRCFKRLRNVRRNCHADRAVNEVYEATERKAAMLRLSGYHVVEKWECEFQEAKKTDPALKAFLDDLDMVPPLDPRDAFYGGRVGAVSLYAKAEEGESIKYCDVTSLYPWVNKYKEYPVRFPLIYTNPWSIPIRAVRICSEDVMEVVTTRADEEVEWSLKTNLFIAIFTTAHARLKLYSALETLQQRVLYYDAELVILKWRPGQVEIPL